MRHSAWYFSFIVEAKQRLGRSRDLFIEDSCIYRVRSTRRLQMVMADVLQQSRETTEAKLAITQAI